MPPPQKKGTPTIRNLGDCITNQNTNATCFNPPKEQITFKLQPAILVLQCVWILLLLGFFCASLLLPYQIFTDTYTVLRKNNGLTILQTIMPATICPTKRISTLALHNIFLQKYQKGNTFLWDPYLKATPFLTEQPVKIAFFLSP